jgi:hypothetical protein
MNFVSTKVDLSGNNLVVGVSTAIVRSMIFSDLEAYNPQANSWSFLSQGIGPQRFGHTATLTTNGDLRLLGGLSCADPQGPSGPQSNCPSRQAVPSVTSIIPRLAPWSATTGMQSPRGNHTSTLLPDGKILIAGGTNGPNVLATSELFDPISMTYSAAGTLREPRDLHTATLLPNGKVLVAGGFTTNSTSTGPTSGSEIYYPETRSWVPTSSMSTPRDNHTATLMGDGNVLVVGGYAGGSYLSSAQIYFSTAAAWRTIAPMNVARALHGVTLLQDGRILVSGGINATGVQGSVEIYDPVAGSWSLAKCMNGGVGAACAGGVGVVRAHSHRMTLLLDGRVLLTGGNDGSGEVDLSSIYDPLANAWTNTAALNAGRFGHTASLLANGNVLVAGGFQALGNSLNSAETFDVAINSWQTTGNLSSARGGHTTILAQDGNLFNFGGCGSSACSNSAELVYFADPPDSKTVGFPPSARKSSIASVDLSPFDRGSPVTLTGRNFQGISEASAGGAAGANSAHYHPRLILQAISASGGGASQGEGGFALDLSTRIYSNAANLWSKTDSSITLTMPSAPANPLPPPGGSFLPYGWYHLRTASNAQFSDSVLVQAGPPKPRLGPSSLAGVVNSSDTITWSWISPGPPLDGFNVYSATTGVFITTVATASPLFVQSLLAPNATAQILVAAYTLSGDGPQAASPVLHSLATAPINVSVSSVSFDSLILSWGTNSNSLGTVYEVSESGNSFQTSFSTPIPTLLGLTASSATLSNLQANTTYFFRVRAFNANGIPSNFSTVVSTRTRAPILGLNGTPTATTSIQWTWNDPGGVTFFKVYNATSGAVMATPQAAIFNDVGLSTNSSRSLMVSAVTSAGEGPLSPPATTFTLAAVPTLTAPPQITSLSTGSLVGVWNPNGNPAGTRYQMLVTMGSVTLSTVTTTTFSAGVGELSPAASVVSVDVKALNEDGVASAFFALGSTSTLANPAANARVLGTSPTTITVAWDSNNNSSSATYQVTATRDDFNTIVSTPLAFSAKSNQTAIVVSGLLTSTTYSIRVQAQNLAGQASPFSNAVTTLTFNGGAPLGSLAATILARQETLLTGTLGGGRSLTLRVPANAFPSDIFLAISTFTVPPSPCGAGGANIGFLITASPELQPSKPVALSFSFTDAELAAIPIPASQAALHRVDASGRCVPLLTTLDSTNLLTAQINHFSQFQVARLSPSATPETALVFPNPFMASRGQGYVTFSQMPAQARVRIFTLRGELVFEGSANASGLLTWGGTNMAGRNVASGIYLAAVEAGGDKKILKIAVLR